MVACQWRRGDFGRSPLVIDTPVLFGLWLTLQALHFPVMLVALGLAEMGSARITGLDRPA